MANTGGRIFSSRGKIPPTVSDFSIVRDRLHSYKTACWRRTKEDLARLAIFD